MKTVEELSNAYTIEADIYWELSARYDAMEENGATFEELLSVYKLCSEQFNKQEAAWKAWHNAFHKVTGEKERA